jgi:Tfp pilus assembly protein PilF
MNLFRRKKPTELVTNEVDIDPAELEPTTAEGYLKRGLIFHARGEQEKAEADLKQVLSMKADSIDAHYNLGLIYREMGKTGDARASFNTALEHIKVMEEADLPRAVMLSRLANWQLNHLAKTG